MIFGVENSVRDGAHKVLWQVLLGLSGYLIAVAGVGFLIIAAYLALSASLGVGPAALLIGIGLVLVGGAILALANRRPAKPVPEDEKKPPPTVSGADAANAGSMLAFTAAFVLGRYLTGDKRD